MFVDRRRFDFQRTVAPNDPVPLRRSSRASVTPRWSMTRKLAERADQLGKRTASQVTQSPPETPLPSAEISRHTIPLRGACDVNGEPTIAGPHPRGGFLPFNRSPRTVEQPNQAVDTGGPTATYQI